jgi:hypothetical protein
MFSMREFYRKHKDEILAVAYIGGAAALTTVAVILIKRITTANEYEKAIFNMNVIAEEAGVLDTLLQHQKNKNLR